MNFLRHNITLKMSWPSSSTFSVTIHLLSIFSAWIWHRHVKLCQLELRTTFTCVWVGSWTLLVQELRSLLLTAVALLPSGVGSLSSGKIRNSTVSCTYLWMARPYRLRRCSPSWESVDSVIICLTENSSHWPQFCNSNDCTGGSHVYVISTNTEPVTSHSIFDTTIPISIHKLKILIG